MVTENCKAFMDLSTPPEPLAKGYALCTSFVIPLYHLKKGGENGLRPALTFGESADYSQTQTLPAASHPSIHTLSSTAKSGGTPCASASTTTSITAGSPDFTARFNAGLI